MSSTNSPKLSAAIGLSLGFAVGLALIFYAMHIEYQREERHRQFAREIYACVATSGARYDDCARATLTLMDSKSAETLQ